MTLAGEHDDPLFMRVQHAIQQYAARPDHDPEALGQMRREAARYMGKIAGPGQKNERDMRKWVEALDEVRQWAEGMLTTDTI